MINNTISNYYNTNRLITPSPVSSDSNDSILKIATLENEYDRLLKEHETKFNEYTKLLASATAETRFEEHISKTYTGAILKTTSTDDISDCLKKCSDNPSCVAATYEAPTCTLYRGLGTLSDGPKTATTAILKLAAARRALEDLDAKIIVIQEQLLTERAQKGIKLGDLIRRGKDRALDLKKREDMLKKERKLLKDTQYRLSTIDTVDEDNQSDVQKKQIIWGGLVVLMAAFAAGTAAMNT